MSNFETKSKQFSQLMSSKAVAHYQKILGSAVGEKSIECFDVGYNKGGQAFTNPERDGAGNVIGITQRLKKGRGPKKAMQGSKRGLVVPSDFGELKGPIFCPEGLTDSMALHTAGVAVVGRPSATGGVTHLQEFLTDEIDREIVVVGDNDEKEDGSWPGKSGAMKTAQRLATDLQVQVKVAFPPVEYKDSREWLNASEGLSKQDVIDQLLDDSSTIAPDAPLSVIQHSPVNVFSNFQRKEDSEGKTRKAGMMAEEIFAQLREVTKGKIYSLNGTVLFALIGDNEIYVIKDHDALLSWLDSLAKVDWASGSEMVSAKRFFLYCLRECETFEAVDTYPHFPSLSGVLYHHPTVEMKSTSPSKFEQVLGMFSPHSHEDQALIKALFLTIFWGGDAGSRPVFLITGPPNDPGRGVGKSFLVSVVADLCGGLMSFDPTGKMSQIKTRLLSPGAIGKRVALIDNIKTSRFSWGELEGLITAPVVSGHGLYIGEAQRPNYLTWVLTMNGASVSKDIAERVLVIKLARPQYTPTWQTDIKAFVEENRWEIISDIKQIIELDQNNETSN